MGRIYQMTAEQSDAWWGGCTEVIEQEIHEDLQDDGNTQDTDVLLDDGRVAFTIWQAVQHDGPHLLNLAGGVA